MKMTSMRKSAGRGGRETKREREREGGQREKLRRRTERDTFPVKRETVCDELKCVWMKTDARPDTMISRD